MGDEEPQDDPIEMPLIQAEASSALAHSTDTAPLSSASVSDDASYPVNWHSPLILPSSRMTMQPFDETGLNLQLIEGAIYPFAEERHYRTSVAASVIIHVVVAVTVVLLAWFFGIKSLRQLMAGPVLQSPPPETIQVVLLQDDDIPPPPTLHPEFIVQKLIQPPAPKPIVKPPPKLPPPQPIIQHKSIKAASSPALKSPATNGALKIVVGSGSFPSPEYPQEALRGKIQGTVTVDITFDGSGHVSSAELYQSSGSRILDEEARNTIVHEWSNPAFANTHAHQAITFSLKAGVH